MAKEPDSKAQRPDPTFQRTAIALKYDGRGAPRISAKGRGEVAERIIALAQENDIPLYEDLQLAALLAQLELDTEIPRALYVAVAEVIAFAYRISGHEAPGAATEPSPQTGEAEASE